MIYSSTQCVTLRVVSCIICFKKQAASLRLGATALWEGNIQCFGLH